MTTPHSLLITAVQRHAAEALAAELRGLGWPAAQGVACASLVPEVVRLAPDAVIALAGDRVEAELLDAIAALRDAAPRPVLLAARTLPRARLGALLEAGVHEWRTPPGSARDWSRWLALAAARFAHERAQHDALALARSRLDERKWIDRAKGVLMRAQQLDEEQAFVLLREASMHANLRVGDVSRGVIEAARAADAVNRSGQLRMLSQRIVKALALRAAGYDAGGAAALLADSRARLHANLDHLKTVLGDDAAEPLAAARAAGHALDAALDAGIAPDAADALAEALLLAADALTAAIEQGIGRGGLHVVNVCGRQRMLSQRLAKQALLARQRSLAAEAIGQTRSAFDAGIAELEAAPLSTDAIRAELAGARGQWVRLQDGARRGAIAVLAHESEALLASFERLTSLYERSMQLLLG